MPKMLYWFNDNNAHKIRIEKIGSRPLHHMIVYAFVTSGNKCYYKFYLAHCSDSYHSSPKVNV